MSLARRAARAALAASFISGGIDQIRNPQPKAAPASPIAKPIADRVPQLPNDPESLVKLDGAIKVVGGLGADRRAVRASGGAAARRQPGADDAGRPPVLGDQRPRTAGVRPGRVLQERQRARRPAHDRAGHRRPAVDPLDGGQGRARRGRGGRRRPPAPSARASPGAHRRQLTGAGHRGRRRGRRRGRQRSSRRLASCRRPAKAKREGGARSRCSPRPQAARPRRPTAKASKAAAKKRQGRREGQGRLGRPPAGWPRPRCAAPTRECLPPRTPRSNAGRSPPRDRASRQGEGRRGAR